MGRKARTRHAATTRRLDPGHPLAGVIEDAYRVFDFPKPEATGVCAGCCMDPEIERDFFTPEIRDLPIPYVRDWFFAACNPGLPRAIWGYLLPRVLELLAAEEEVAYVGLEVSLSRFPTGDRAQWSDAQWEVLDRFQRGFLSHYAQGSDEYLDDALCMFGNAGWPLDDLFAQVAAWPDEFLARRLWCDWCRCFAKNIWLTAFWEAPGNTKAFNFYTSRALYDRMVALGMAEGTPEETVAEALAVADVIWANADWSDAPKGGPENQELPSTGPRVT